MLILDPSLNFIETAESDVVEVYKSTSPLTMKQEDLPGQPCDSYICAVQDGPVILVYVALLLKYSKKTLIYVDGSRTDKLTDYHESLNEALTFLTSMGFTMENVNLNYSDALKSAILRGIRVLRPVSAARLAAKRKSGAEKGMLNKAEAELSATKKAASKKTETERLSVEKAARERAEQERQAAEEAARERADQARRAAGYAAEEREEAERLAEETTALANERIEQAEAERYATEEAIRKFTEAEKIAAENAKAEKISVEEIRANRIAAEKGIAQKAEAERLAAEKATKARQEEEAATAERLAAEKLVREKIATEKIASAKSAKEHAAAEKIKKEWIAAEEAAAQIAEEEKNAAEKYADAQKAEETATAARQAAEGLLRDKTELLKIVRGRSEAEIAAARQMVLGKIAAEKTAAEKAVEALAVLKVIPAAEDDSETTGPEHGPTKQAAREEDGAERLAAEIAAGEKAGVENEAVENADRSATEANDETELLSALKRVKEKLKVDTNAAAKDAECLATKTAASARVEADREPTEEAAAKKLKTGKTVEELAEALRIAADMAAAEEAAEELRAKGITLPPPSAVTIPVLAAEPAVAQAIVQTTPPATASQEFAPSSAVNDDLDPFSFMGGRQETGDWPSNNDGQSSGSGTVFLVDTSRKWLEYTSEEDIIALQKSINVARAALEGNVTQSCKGYICLINEEGNSHVYLAISLSSGGKVLIYAPYKQPASPEECTMVTNDGIHFLELIGFMMDSVKLDGDQETRAAEISKMPFLRRLTPET